MKELKVKVKKNNGNYIVKDARIRNSIKNIHTGILIEKFLKIIFIIINISTVVILIDYIINLGQPNNTVKMFFVVFLYLLLTFAFYITNKYKNNYKRYLYKNFNIKINDQLEILN